ncbi:MAG: radical SAM protein [Rhodovulum sulfidophilum]|uniref:Radical SAM protein n=1 Tax=Rhodovulum sulfidophilum TaxID=35806 RepID=A0A2W5NCQ7_RHOSU|nr:MAG: radical SAM protein [Rhodovulum sulfidophilum]
MIGDESDKMDKARRRARGAASNRDGRFERYSHVGFDDGWDLEEEPLPPLRTEVAMERARSILTRNTSPDLAFDRSINPYRGCEHGCVYCFARPSHAFLGLSPGLDFETRLTAKPNAAERLAAELSRKSYVCAPIAIGTNTDPYQPVEKRLGITRAILGVLRDFNHPVSILTKGALITRDTDILGPMGAAGLATAGVSLTTLDPALARAMEPRASAPATRLATIRALAAAGCPVWVSIGPVIPGLNDMETERLLAAAKDAGARAAGYIVLRLPREVGPIFQDWLAESFPDRARKVMGLVRQIHGGKDYDPEWGKRMKGEGPVAELIARRFKVASRRLGLDQPWPPLRRDLFRPPRGGPEQLSLF